MLLVAMPFAPSSFAYAARYYENNVVGLLNLVKVLKRHHVSKSLVLSSSCTVYRPSDAKISEDSLLEPTCPYGNTKHLDWHYCIGMKQLELR